MFYQSDYKINQFLPRYKRRSLGELKKKLKIKKTEVKNPENDLNEGILLKYILSFCENTSIHGVKFVGQDLHWFERCESQKISIIIFMIFSQNSLGVSCKSSNFRSCFYLSATI